MKGKRKVLVIYHNQSAFKPEVELFINQMAERYQLSLGKYKPADIKGLVDREPVETFGDFILVCPKGKETTKPQISKAFDDLSKFVDATPDGEAFIYVDAHGSQSGAREGLEDIDVLEGATKGTTHFPDDTVDYKFWEKESEKLKKFKKPVPVIIDTCHSTGVARNDKPTNSDIAVA